MQTFKKITQSLIKAIQRVIMSVSLFFIYYLIFGITKAIAFVFNRRLLKGHKEKKDSAWLVAAGYENDPANSKMQS